MIKLNELKEDNTIWRIYEDSDIVKYINIRYFNNYGSEGYLSFTYGDESNYDIDYGYPYACLYQRDEKDLFYSKDKVLVEIENRKNKLANELKDKNKLIEFLYNKSKSKLTGIEIKVCEELLKSK